jgi:hypothetical protein
MAYLDPNAERLAAEEPADGRLAVDIRGSAEPAWIIAMPFYR